MNTDFHSFRLRDRRARIAENIQRPQAAADIRQSNRSRVEDEALREEAERESALRYRKRSRIFFYPTIELRHARERGSRSLSMVVRQIAHHLNFKNVNPP